MDPEYVNMPVPIDRVQEVYELLARPSGASGAAGVDAASAVPGAWSEELLRRAYEESPDAMRTILDTLASRPGEAVSVAVLADALGQERRQVGGALGAFGHRWKKRYRQGEGRLPFKAYRSSDLGMTVYEMSHQVAAVFAAAVERTRR